MTQTRQTMDFEVKHDFNPSYTSSRLDVLKLVPLEIKHVLDIGCSIGRLGESIKRRNGAEVIGIEVDERMANVAKEKLNHVIVGNVEEINMADYFSTAYFDCMIFADVLEHLKNPWDVLKNATHFLNNEGFIIACIPNIRHYTSIISLLFKGYWPYRERGIHDRNHLRFFTLKNITEMFRNAGLKITRVERAYRIIEKPHRYNRFSGHFAHLFLKDFLTFQFLIVGRKKSAKNV